VHAQKGWDKELQIQKLHPITIRPIFKPMRDVTLTVKWYAHDLFKPENQVKKVLARDSKEGVTSKQQPTKKYLNVDAIKWSNDYPKTYERGKPFLPNRDIQRLPLGIRRFHDWYLRVILTTIDLIQARFPAGAFRGPYEKIIFDFNDVWTCFHLRAMETNLIRTWCL
jgi:hypothetical protein